jgi:RHS repeat-associated protein
VSKQTTTSRKGHQGVNRLTRTCHSRWKKHRTKYSYDLNGNLLSDGTRYFAYDDENQLTSVWMTNVWRSDFVYDGMLRRRIERDFTWQSSSWVKTNEVRYIYDVNVVVQERDMNNLPLVTYTRGNDVSGGLQGAGGIGGLLARTDNGQWIGGNPNAHADYFFDGNGNVAGLVNTNGAIVAQYTYDPFGNILSMSGPLASANTYRFSSKEWNNNAGLYYYGRRFYDPSLQRWLNRDPIEEDGGINMYGFCDNNPVCIWDGFGLCSPNWAKNPLGGSSAESINYAARVVYAEASNSTDDQLAVASVLRNRLGANGLPGGVQNTLQGVANAPGQFQSVFDNTPKFRNSSAGNAGGLSDAECAALNNAIYSAQMAAAWGTPDFMGAIYPYNEFRAAGPNVPPGWTKIGGNRFRTNPKIGGTP